uniref:GRF-type domain-containing protein n=1 Tax=Eucalyptus grandis TaxID=71139 RepID=A0A059D3S1_EUCGR
MESRTFSSGSNFSRRSEGEGERLCFCGLPSPRRILWTRTNSGRRFYGCARYREGSKCKYFKWVDAKFSHRAIEVIVDLFDGCHQPSSTLVDDLDDVDSIQA